MNKTHLMAPLVTASILFACADPQKQPFENARREFNAKNYSAAIPALQSLANAAYPPAENLLGIAYENGEGVEKNLMQAVTLYKKAADQGYAMAQANLGTCYHLGVGVPRDDLIASTYYLKAAKQGNAIAQYNYAVLLFEKSDVPDTRRTQNQIEATEWFEKAAKNGDAQASDYLSVIYCFGLGQAPDYSKAAHHAKIAAEKGLSKGQCVLGNLYDKGLGVAQDEQKAIMWLEKAAAQEAPYAEDAMAQHYYEGRGVPRDIEKAYLLASKAYAHGNVQSTELQAKIQAALTPDQISALQNQMCHEEHTDTVGYGGIQWGTDFSSFVSAKQLPPQRPKPEKLFLQCHSDILAPLFGVDPSTFQDESDIGDTPAEFYSVDAPKEDVSYVFRNERMCMVFSQLQASAYDSCMAKLNQEQVPISVTHSQLAVPSLSPNGDYRHDFTWNLFRRTGTSTRIYLIKDSCFDPWRAGTFTSAYIVYIPSSNFIALQNLLREYQLSKQQQEDAARKKVLDNMTDENLRKVK